MKKLIENRKTHHQRAVDDELTLQYRFVANYIYADV